MILKTLTLVNYRKFKNSVVEFPDGIIGVIGLNGVGKSTIFEAIAWVLYGPVAARTSADQIKRGGAADSDPCRVELDFIFEDERYRIVREMSGKNLSASASVLVNDKLAASGAETASKYIQKRLGMDFKSFFTSIFAKQKELNVLSAMNASERRPLILKMLGIDELDEVVKEIRADKKNKDTLIEKLSQDITDEKTGKSKIESYDDEIKSLNKKKEDSDKSIKEIKEKIQSLKKEVENLEKNCASNKKEYEKINLLKEKLAEEKTFFENKKKLDVEIKNLQSKITERQKIIETQRKKTKGFEKLDADAKEVEKKLKSTDEEIEKLVKKIEQEKTLAENIKENISDMECKKKNILKLGPDAKCPTCDRLLGEQHNKLLKNFDKEKQEKAGRVESILKNIKAALEGKDKFSREKQAFEKKRNYLQAQLREKERIDATIDNILAEMGREKIELENKEKQSKNMGTVDFAIAEYESVKNQVNEFYKKYQSSLDSLTDKKETLGDSKLELEKKDGEKNLIAQRIKNLQDKMAELEEFKKKIKDEKKNAQQLGTLSEVMSSFRSHLISRIQPTLSSYASDYFERLTDGKYQQMELDEDYNIMIYDDGNSYSIQRFSGGEEDLANLCLRLAISEVITERAGGIFNFIILDEIFGSQDMIRRQNIMKALNGLSSKFRQIFLITHIDDVKNYVENVINVSENEDGTSIVKIE
ncbi:MAG: SMC family ATPase [Euryarchaeota archaeon]|nr:SMC family ATPase [Euryarchaeota archaeon]